MFSLISWFACLANLNLKSIFFSIHFFLVANHFNFRFIRFIYDSFKWFNGKLIILKLKMPWRILTAKVCNFNGKFVFFSLFYSFLFFSYHFFRSDQHSDCMIEQMTMVTRFFFARCFLFSFDCFNWKLKLYGCWVELCFRKREEFRIIFIHFFSHIFIADFFFLLSNVFLLLHGELKNRITTPTYLFILLFFYSQSLVFNLVICNVLCWMLFFSVMIEMEISQYYGAWIRLFVRSTLHRFVVGWCCCCCVITLAFIF